MTTPTPEIAVQSAPARIPEINTFDQALDQRRRAQAADASIPKGLWDLGDMALRIGHERSGATNFMPLNSQGHALGSPTQVQQAGTPNGGDMTARALALIDRSFGYAVLTQQLVRGANQVATGLNTLLRST
jgi:hypothetical protein